MATTALRAENDILVAVRGRLGGAVIFTEQTPCDATAQHVDGSFTVHAQLCRKAVIAEEAWRNPSWVNLTRFALPTVKAIELISTDGETPNQLGGDDGLDLLRPAFFNGEAVRIHWPAVRLYPQGSYCWTEDQKAFVKKMHEVMHSY